MRSFANSYHKAAIKFVWKYEDIEQYIPLIRLAIPRTYKWFKEADQNISINDIKASFLKDDDNKTVAFALYINNKRFGERGSIYSIFREEYKVIAQGYDNRVPGFRFPPSTLERMIELYKQNHDTANIPENKIIDYWNQIQSLKRKITNFITLANKSINRGRRVPSRLRFEILKRDNFKCILCGRSATDTTLHVDHITPVVKGGGNKKESLATLCMDCNLGKGISEVFDEI